MTRGGELLGHRRLHDEPLRGDAALPGIEEPAPHGQVRDPRQIGVGQHPQLAVIVAGGVLIDTFVVRSLQVPGA